MLDLLAAADAVRDDERVGRGRTHRGKQRSLGSEARGYGFRYWSSVNNSDVGIWYTGAAFFFFLFGGILALLLRLQLAVPRNDFLSAELYNQAFTVHSSVMMFLFAIPVFEAIAVILMPQMLGARDLPFPRLAAFGFWCFLLGGLFLSGSIFFGAAPRGGWFMYPPLTSTYQKGIGPDIWLLGFSFILKLPGMDPEDYRNLAGLDLRAPPEAPASLAIGSGCHGADGQGRGGASPRLAGQSPTYLYCALNAYAAGERFSGTMESVASALSDGVRRELAHYFGGLGAEASSEPADREAVSRGESIALLGIPRQRVPSCSDCHGPTSRSRKPNYPFLAGQHQSYLRRQLELFGAGSRGGTPYAHLMDPVVRNLTKEQIEDVTLFYSSLGPGAAGAFEMPWGDCGSE
jgi:cytochrome c553